MADPADKTAETALVDDRPDESSPLIEEPTIDFLPIPELNADKKSKPAGSDASGSVVIENIEMANVEPEKQEPPAPSGNMYVAARGHVQRVIDVALLISNMSRMSTVLSRRDDYDDLQVNMLMVALTLSMIAQIVAGICFFITQQRENNNVQEQDNTVDYVAYACVGLVMVLNIFISTFDASWAGEAATTAANTANNQSAN